MNIVSQFIVEDRLSLIQRVMQSGDYDVAVKETCTLFELVFRRIFQTAIASLPFRDRDHILETERKIGKGTKGVQDFGFGELVGLYRESKLLEKWAKHTGRDMGILLTLDFGAIVNLRNQITHKGASCSRGEANLVFEYLRNLLAVLGFADLERSIDRSFERESEPGDPKLRAEESGAGNSSPQAVQDRLPKIQKSMRGPSRYSSSFGQEGRRLKVQAGNYRAIDMRALEQVLAEMDAGAGTLVALDLGCASGELTADRFGAFDCFAHVIGVDRNSEKIAQAGAADYGSPFSFHELDVEADDFEQKIEDILRAKGKEQFDVILSALTIHHLSHPIKAIFKLRKLLRPGGYILLRGSDDGSKLAYPDEQDLVPHIMYMTRQVEGTSDRENGRKLYNQLWSAGFRSVQMLYEIKDTAGRPVDERMALYEGSFSYRINHFKRRLDEAPGDPKVREEYEWMKDALQELEMQFFNEGFYYQETVYMAVARR